MCSEKTSFGFLIRSNITAYSFFLLVVVGHHGDAGSCKPAGTNLHDFCVAFAKLMALGEIDRFVSGRG